MVNFKISFCKTDLIFKLFSSLKTYKIHYVEYTNLGTSRIVYELFINTYVLTLLVISRNLYGPE